MPKTNKSPEQLFWEKVDKSAGEDACWPWLAARSHCSSKTLYGVFRWRGGGYNAHKVAYVMASGTEVMPGLEVCHTCGNSLCVNPSHLYVGTRKENMRDVALAGTAKGKRGPKMREEQVRRILLLRAAGETQENIARIFGVSRMSVSNITRGIYFKHVYEEFHGAKQEQELGNVA